MAPIKYEEQMKDKLEKRSLQPSPESWGRLANRLDVENKRKNKSAYWWFGIAASVVGIVLVTIMYFTSKPFENVTPVIVDNPKEGIQNKSKKENQVLEVPIQSNEVAVEEEGFVKKPTRGVASEPGDKTFTSEKSTQEITLLQQDAVVQVNLATTEGPIDKVTEIKKSTLTFEAQKIQDVVMQINKLKSKGNSVTEAELDSLLKKAHKEILSNRLYNKTTRTVDANELLQDVEADLQQSFRSKVFEALQSGYESVRTAVAERNN